MGKTLFTFTSKADWQAGTVPPQIDLESEPGKVKLYRPTTLFSRASAAYLPDGAQVLSGNPRYVAGKFGKGILIEEGTTNQYAVLVSQGQGLSPNSSSVITQTLAQVDPFGGTKAVRLQTTGGTAILKAVAGAAAVPNGVSWTGQIWVRNRIATVLTVHSNQGNQSATVTQAEGWKKIGWTITGNGVGIAQHQLRVPAASDVLDCDVAFLQYEDKPYATSWVIGGTPRSTEVVTMPTTGISETKGTIKLWVNLAAKHFGITTKLDYLWCIPRKSDNSPDGFTLTHRSDLAQWQVRWYKDASNIALNFTVPDSNAVLGWNRFVVVWDGLLVKLYINGVPVGSGTATAPPDMPGPFARLLAWDNISLGNRCANTYVDDFEILTDTLTPTEVLADYNATSPATATINTLGLCSFDDSLLSEYPPSATLTTKAFDLGGMHEMPLRLEMPISGGLIQITHYQSSPDGVNGWGPWLDMQGDKTGPYVGPWIRFKIVLYVAP